MQSKQWLLLILFSLTSPVIPAIITSFFAAIERSWRARRYLKSTKILVQQEEDQKIESNNIFGTNQGWREYKTILFIIYS